MAEPGIIDGVFSVEVVGAGRPMIFLPELACSARIWDQTVAHFQQRFECHVIFPSGFAGAAQGHSYRSPLSTLKRGLAEYFRMNGLNLPIIVGHGAGAFVALSLAIDNPGRIGPLVVVEAFPFYAGAGSNRGVTLEMAKEDAKAVRSVYTSDPEPNFERAAEAAKSVLVTDPQHVARIVWWRRISDRATMGHALYELLSTDLRPNLSKIATPMLVIGTWLGKRDFAGMTKSSVRQIFRDQYANARDCELLFMDSSRHFVMLDDLPGFLHTIDAFLQRTVRENDAVSFSLLSARSRFSPEMR